jgi:hypothetical protein
MNGLVILAGIVGVGFIVLAVVYFITPASSLPSFIPGYDPSTTHIHYTHAVASLVVGLAALALAWFKSGKKSTSPSTPE